LASIAFHDPRLSSTSGGAETVTLQLISLLLGAGHQVAVVTRKAKRSRLFAESVARYSELDCNEVEIPDGAAKALPEDDPTVRNIRNCDHLALESLCFNVAAQGFYRTHSFDVVVVSFIPDLALLQTQGRILLNVFGLPPNEEIALLERPLLERCHAMTFASHYTKEKFRAMFHMEDQDLGPVVHASIGLHFFDYPSQHGKAFDVCFVGRLARLAVLLGTGGTRAVLAENMLLKQQLLVHGELAFKRRLAVQTIRGNGFANGNSQGRLGEVLGRPLSPRVCRPIALDAREPRCSSF
jgi:hypothetical protein